MTELSSGETTMDGTGGGEFSLPSSIQWGGASSFYVVDSGGGRIQKFDCIFTFVFDFGQIGDGSGE